MSKSLDNKAKKLDHIQRTISWDEIISEVPEECITLRQNEKSIKQIANDAVKDIYNWRRASSR